MTMAGYYQRWVGQAVRVRRWRVGIIVVAAVGLCLTISLLTEWSDRALIVMALKGAGTAGAAGERQSMSGAAALSYCRELARSEAVLSRTLAVLFSPESPAVAEWKQARRQWEAERSSEAWEMLEGAFRRLDAEIERLRRDGSEGPIVLDRMAWLSRRVDVSPAGPDAPADVLTMSVSWPVKRGDVRPVAECLAVMTRDRLIEAQIRAAHETAGFVRLRRERLRLGELAPAENALREFAEQELESPADLAHLEQMSRLAAEADLPVAIRRLRQDLAAIDSQRDEAGRLRRLLLESLPEALWGGGPRRDQDGEWIAPPAASLDRRQLGDDDAILANLTLIIPKEAVERNIVLERLKGREADLLVELGRLRSEFNPGYLGIADKRAELARVRREILTQVVGEAAQLQVAIGAWSARYAELERRVEACERQFQRLSGKLSRYQQLVQDLEAARKRYLTAWLDETQIIKDQEQGLPAALLLEPEIICDYGGRRAMLADPRRACAVGGIAGAVLALAYALVAGLLDRTLRWPDQVQRHVGVPAVGQVRRVGDRIVA